MRNSTAMLLPGSTIQNHNPETLCSPAVALPRQWGSHSQSIAIHLNRAKGFRDASDAPDTGRFTRFDNTERR